MNIDVWKFENASNLEIVEEWQQFCKINASLISSVTYDIYKSEWLDKWKISASINVKKKLYCASDTVLQ